MLMICLYCSQKLALLLNLLHRVLSIHTDPYLISNITLHPKDQNNQYRITFPIPDGNYDDNSDNEDDSDEDDDEEDGDADSGDADSGDEESDDEDYPPNESECETKELALLWSIPQSTPRATKSVFATRLKANVVTEERSTEIQSKVQT